MVWTVEKIIRIKKETKSTWALLDNILNYSSLKVRLDALKDFPEKFPTKSGKLTSENLTDTLIPFVQSISEFARDNGNKQYYKKLQDLLNELQNS